MMTETSSKARIFKCLFSELPLFCILRVPCISTSPIYLLFEGRNGRDAGLRGE